MDDEVWCHMCYKVFASRQAAASHRNRAYSEGNAGWKFATNGKCQVCHLLRITYTVTGFCTRTPPTAGRRHMRGREPQYWTHEQKQNCDHKSVAV